MLKKNLQLYKFSAYGFLKNLRFFDAFLFLFFRGQGFSFLEIGTLISIREVSIMIMEIPTGIVADSYGRRRSMIFSFLSYIASFIIFFFFPKFGFYAIAMVLFGLGEAFRSGTHKAMILAYLELNEITDQKVEYYGFTRSWSQIGSAIAALIAGAIVFFSGNYKYIFLGSVIPYFMALLLMISYPKNLDGELCKANSANCFSKSLHFFFDTIKDFYKEMKKPILRKAIINSALFDGLFKTTKDYIQPILQAFALSTPVMLLLKDERDTIIISLVYFMLFLLTAFASRKSKKFGSLFSSLAKAINSSYISGIMLILITGILYHFGFKSLTILGFIIFYMFQNMRRPLNVGCISEIISSKVMASGLSLESQLKTMFIAVMSPLMGYLADTFGIGLAIVALSSLTLLVFPFIKVR
jgi:MFS family permease